VGIAVVIGIRTRVGPVAVPAVTGPDIDVHTSTPSPAPTAPAGFCRVGGKCDKGERKRSHCHDQSCQLAHLSPPKRNWWRSWAKNAPPTWAVSHRQRPI